MDETDQGSNMPTQRTSTSSYTTYDHEGLEDTIMVESSGGGGGDFTEERYGLFIFTVIGCVAFVIVAILFAREFYLHKYNFDIITWTHNNSRNPNLGINSSYSLSDSSHGRSRGQQGQTATDAANNNPQSYVESDRELAEELQRRLNDEEREAERMRKRADRREWYQAYLKPFTMVAEKKDFFYAHEMNDSPKNHVDDSEAEEEEKSGTTTKERRDRFRTMSTGELSEKGDDFPTDLELGACNSSDDDDEDEDDEEPIICTEDADDAHLYVRLPVFKHDHQRSVDANCSICIADYEVGDRIVWSNSECKHAFHEGCIMTWLAKGKKRCPMCRHWFVPGTRIEDQRKALLAATAVASATATAATESSSSSSLADTDDIPPSPRVDADAEPTVTAQTDSTHDELDISQDGSASTTADCDVLHQSKRTDTIAEHDDDKGIHLDSSTESSKYESSEILSDDVELGGRSDVNDSSNNTSSSAIAATNETSYTSCEDPKISSDDEGAELV